MGQQSVHPQIQPQGIIPASFSFFVCFQLPLKLFLRLSIRPYWHASWPQWLLYLHDCKNVNARARVTTLTRAHACELERRMRLVMATYIIFDPGMLKLLARRGRASSSSGEFSNIIRNTFTFEFITCMYICAHMHARARKRTVTVMLMLTLTKANAPVMGMCSQISPQA